jgi:hypothetical protein
LRSSSNLLPETSPFTSYTIHSWSSILCFIISRFRDPCPRYLNICFSSLLQIHGIFYFRLECAIVMHWTSLFYSPFLILIDAWSLFSSDFVYDRRTLFMANPLLNSINTHTALLSYLTDSFPLIFLNSKRFDLVISRCVTSSLADQFKYEELETGRTILS